VAESATEKPLAATAANQGEGIANKDGSTTMTGSSLTAAEFEVDSGVAPWPDFMWKDGEGLVPAGRAEASEGCG
jgi:hypothetical protein